MHKIKKADLKNRIQKATDQKECVKCKFNIDGTLSPECIPCMDYSGFVSIDKKK